MNHRGVGHGHEAAFSCNRAVSIRLHTCSALYGALAKSRDSKGAAVYQAAAVIYEWVSGVLYLDTQSNYEQDSLRDKLEMMKVLQEPKQGKGADRNFFYFLRNCD
jgi:hypothetical protein